MVGGGGGMPQAQYMSSSMGGSEVRVSPSVVREEVGVVLIHFP